MEEQLDKNLQDVPLTEMKVPGVEEPPAMGAATGGQVPPELAEGAFEEQEMFDAFSPENRVKDLMAQDPGASDAKIAQWKQLYGEKSIYALPLEGDRVYVYRPFSRVEHKKILAMLADASSKLDETQREEFFQEKVVEACLLYPEGGPDFVSVSRAGTVPTLYEAVMYVSNFLPPQLVIANIVPL